MATRDEIYQYVTSTLEKLMEDWDDADEELGPDSLLFTGLGLESLDAVVLGTNIQEHYKTQMPFAELLAELGEHQKDISVNELVDWVHKHIGAGAQVQS